MTLKLNFWRVCGGFDKLFSASRTPRGAPGPPPPHKYILYWATHQCAVGEVPGAQHKFSWF